MKPNFELSATLRLSLVLVLMFFMLSQVYVQAVRSFRVLYLTAPNGSISSPNYPKAYPTDIEWTWILESTQHKVILEIKEMDLYRCYLVDPRHENCQNYDHVTITNYGIYCNGIKPDKVISFEAWSGTIYITFTSLNSRKQCRGNGFKAFYQLVQETPTPSPTTSVPTRPTEKRHKTVDSSKAILEVTIPIVFGAIVIVSILIVTVLWCCRKKSNNPHSSPAADRNDRAMESRNRLLGLQIERHSDSTRRSRQERVDSVRYSDIMLRNNPGNARDPSNYDPPPSYDDIVGRGQQLNRPRHVEFPPSYESVVSESSAHA